MYHRYKYLGIVKHSGLVGAKPPPEASEVANRSNKFHDLTTEGTRFGFNGEGRMHPVDV